MKSVMAEAATISKAVEEAWKKAGNPIEFFTKIVEEPKAGFLGFGAKNAIVALFFNKESIKTEADKLAKPEVVRQESYVGFFNNKNLTVENASGKQPQKQQQKQPQKKAHPTVVQKQQPQPQNQRRKETTSVQSNQPVNQNRNQNRNQQQPAQQKNQNQNRQHGVPAATAAHDGATVQQRQSKPQRQQNSAVQQRENQQAARGGNQQNNQNRNNQNRQAQQNKRPDDAALPAKEDN